MTPSATFMADGGWVLFTFISTLFSCAILVVNQYLKQPGHILIFWSRLVTVCAMAPFMQHIGWPQSPVFYIAILLTIPTGVFADIRTANVSARHGGGVVARTQPIIIFLSFFLWLFFDPALIGAYAAHPAKTAGVMASLAGCMFFSSRLKKCDISRSAFMLMLPALFGYTASMLLNKFAMSHGPLTSAVFCYMYLQSMLSVPVLGAYAFWRERRTKKQAAYVYWRTRKMLLAAFLMSFCWIGHMIFKNYAIVFVPNPSYIVAINQTAPVYIALFYFFMKHKEEADVASGFGVVASAALLALITA